MVMLDYEAKGVPALVYSNVCEVLWSFLFLKLSTFQVECLSFFQFFQLILQLEKDSFLERLNKDLEVDKGEVGVMALNEVTQKVEIGLIFELQVALSQILDDTVEAISDRLLQAIVRLLSLESV